MVVPHLSDQFYLWLVVEVVAGEVRLGQERGARAALVVGQAVTVEAQPPKVVREQLVKETTVAIQITMRSVVLVEVVLELLVEMRRQ